MSFPSLVQLICNEGRDALLQVNYQGNMGDVFFSSGEVVHASILELSGEDAFRIIAKLQEGEFSLHYDIASKVRTISRTWSSLLLEAMHAMDDNTLQEMENRFVPIIEKLMAIDGVMVAIVVTTEGKQLAGPYDSALLNSYNTAFLIATSEELGDYLQLGEFIQVSASNDEQAILVFSYWEHCFMVRIEPGFDIGKMTRKIIGLLQLMS